MIPSYYKSPNNDFTVIQGDCVETLSKFRFGFDMVFADPPYFLSGGGISYQSGKVVCVDKGVWDKPTFGFLAPITTFSAFNNSC